MAVTIPGRRFLAALFCVVALAGCQTLGGSGLIASSAYGGLSPEAANAIAGDMVGRLAEHVGPGTTTIQLRPDGSVFGQTLEHSLKGWGYAVATDQKAEGTNVVPLAYVVDSFDNGVLARLSTESLTLTRIYAITSTGAMPTSPLSVMTAGQGG
ncbi:conjugal transfer protein TrbH [Aquamicrobium sp. NLF2-7]|uniref:conjugal transfer protein TrbH n=1 Tax=Aquamicrobium sp. NLF2-7 TaxID=2918753 RepID=UPI001EFC00BA|nr:conjugal transfer protein TrbH [Aquamicrobium sp. NLF2-7]MCG8273821.1 conjugal transfer protein TrbH [Aquamicrobium sp. NLF2-7]MCG8273973.1 conjugal transfer protein TrbH [Aquamicrobium sp. NLF2-7]